MKRSSSTNSSNTIPTPSSSELSASIERRASGRFRVVVHFGLHPITGKRLRSTYMFDTEREAIIFRDTLLQEPSRLLARIRRQLEVDTLPPPPGYPERRFFLIRGRQVMLDSDVAQMFGTRTGLLNQAVSRNHRRFPDDFAFRLTSEEADRLRSLGIVKRPGQG